MVTLLPPPPTTSQNNTNPTNCNDNYPRFWDLYNESDIALAKYKLAPPTAPKVAWVDGGYVDHKSGDLGPNYKFEANVSVPDEVARHWRYGRTHYPADNSVKSRGDPDGSPLHPPPSVSPPSGVGSKPSLVTSHMLTNVCAHTTDVTKRNLIQCRAGMGTTLPSATSTLTLAKCLPL